MWSFLKLAKPTFSLYVHGYEQSPWQWVAFQEMHPRRKKVTCLFLNGQGYVLSHKDQMRPKLDPDHDKDRVSQRQKWQVTWYFFIFRDCLMKSPYKFPCPRKVKMFWNLSWSLSGVIFQLIPFLGISPQHHPTSTVSWAFLIGDAHIKATRKPPISVSNGSGEAHSLLKMQILNHPKCRVQLKIVLILQRYLKQSYSNIMMSLKYEMGHPVAIHRHEAKFSTGTACSYIMSPSLRDFSVGNKVRWV